MDLVAKVDRRRHKLMLLIDDDDEVAFASVALAVVGFSFSYTRT